MAAFSYRHRLPFAALDPPYLSGPPPADLPLHPPPQQHQAGAAPSWLPCHRPFEAADSPAAPCSSLSNGGRAVPSGDRRVVVASSSSSSSAAQLSEVASEGPSPMEKKRKERRRQRAAAGAAPATDAKAARSRKQRKLSCPEKEPAPEQKRKKAVPPEAPGGYIHVRARRGQATDSHSLAERARREKISERMKMLQGLVPGCDKVVGKALMLDEIINYVQSLQHQVEFLSMKLAAVNPVLYDSCFDLDQLLSGYAPENPEHAPPPAGHLPPSAFMEATGNCPLQDATASFLLPAQGPNAFLQDNGGSFLMQLGGDNSTERLFNQGIACPFD